jgi:hypothetical protein
LTEGVVPLEFSQARDVAAAIGAEGGDDVVGAAVVQGLGVRSDRRANSLDDLGK